jgi:hypothetical protein
MKSPSSTSDLQAVGNLSPESFPGAGCAFQLQSDPLEEPTSIETGHRERGGRERPKAGAVESNAGDPGKSRRTAVMSRINQNIPSLIAQRVLGGQNKGLAQSLQRLSTGLRINRGADDPAGLIVSERLRSELKGLTQAIDNSERASSVISTTEGYLAEVADLLNSISSLVMAGRREDAETMILEGKKWKGLQCSFSPRISRIEEDFTDKMGLIYPLSGSPNW